MGMNDEKPGAEGRWAHGKVGVMGYNGAVLTGLGLSERGPCWRRHDMNCEKWGCEIREGHEW